MADLLSRTAYRKLIKELQKYREECKEDRREFNPFPLCVGMPIRMSIEKIVRESPEDRFQRNLPDRVLEHLANKGLLVRFMGDYIFPHE